MLQKAARKIRRWARRARRAWQSEARAWASRVRLRPRAVLYESFAGNGALCNPEAIFRELLRSPDLADLRHIWALDGSGDHAAIREEFAGDARVRFVRYRSLRYYRALASSGYLINNATFPTEFSKRTGQTYLNTWHGTPLKAMGYDMPNGAVDSANTLKNFVAADFLLSQNHFMTTQMYEKAYRLRGVFRGTVIEEGYPRADRQVLDHDGFLAGRALLEKAGLDLGGRDVVLYAPTWKGSSFSNPDDDARELVGAARRLQDLLGDDRYVVLLKTHQVVHKLASSNPDFRGVLVPNDIPTNVILGLTSVLITDYSSIFFDYLSTSRPIVFYTPDATEYTDTRGTYFATSDLPGAVTADLVEVADQIIAGVPTDTPTYESWRERFTADDDGGSARRVVDIVFRGESGSHRTLSLLDDDRTSVLLYLGGMRSNGITSSALNLLRSIDHDRFDVSVLIARPLGAQQRANQALIDPRVRQFQRMGGMNGHKLPHIWRKRSNRRGDPSVHRESASQSSMWDDEWKRCFGDARFTAAADFSGYSPFWTTLILRSPGSEHSVWLHNDMAAEEHRVIRGRHRQAHSLRAVFALYSQFQRLVSVSPALAQVNAQSLAPRYGIPTDSFVFARNLVDETRVMQGMGHDVLTLEENLELPEPPEWALEMTRPRSTTWFVTVGRFSTEKNQARMIRAFAAVAAERADVRLILVGYGPLREELEALIESLGLGGRAFVVGPLGNPFAVLAASDCFVLSSNHEGQPMVLLEAAAIGLPIVSVRFGSVEDALDGDQIHTVAQDDDSLAEGMRAFLRGEVPPATLDAHAYNTEVMQEFTDAILSSEGSARPA